MPHKPIYLIKGAFMLKILKRLPWGKFALLAVLLPGVGWLAIQAKEHLEEDEQIKIEKLILINNLRNFESELQICTESKEEYQKYADSPEIQGLKIIASAVHPKILLLKATQDDGEPLYNAATCVMLTNRYKSLLEHVEKSLIFTQVQKEYLLLLVSSEAMDMVDKCESDLQVF